MKINRKCKSYNREIIIALFSIVFSIILGANTTNIYNYILSNELIINPNKEYAYNLWKDTPFPISMDIYFFNWTNPEDINKANIKPRLVEIGPYRFNENKKKVDILWHNNGTISFKHLRFWHFDPENSIGNLDDEITSVNPVATATAAVAKHFNYLVQKTLSISFKALVNNVHTTKKVREILFEGYEDPLLNIANKFPKIPGVEVPPFQKFGWFVERNGSKNYDGKFIMGTGENSSIKFGELNQWNDQKVTQFYSGECSKISGSAGEFFPQNLPKTEVNLFISDMCRSVSFQFAQEDEFMNIKAYKYVGGDKTFDNGTRYPENSCYNSGENISSGIASVQQCRYGAPGYISFPHFYLADPVYGNCFDGLEPSKEKHEFSFLMEPRTGIPLYVDAKFQVNLLIESNPNIALFNNVPKLYFPILWFEERVIISDEIATHFKLLLSFPFINNCVALIIGFIGIVLLTSTLCKRRYEQRFNNKNFNFISEDAGTPLKILETN